MASRSIPQRLRSWQHCSIASPDMFVSGYDDFCLEVTVHDYDFDGAHVCDAVFDHGCLNERGHGPWDSDYDE